MGEQKRKAESDFIFISAMREPYRLFQAAVSGSGDEDCGLRRPFVVKKCSDFAVKMPAAARLT